MGLKLRDWFVPDVLLALDELGSGGMGAVYVGYHMPGKELVAIKTLFPEFSKDEAYILRFRREAAVYQKLCHPNIVRYVDSGLHDGTHFIALEFIHGRALDELMKEKGSYPVQQALDIFEPLAEAVGHSHEKSIIHRDLKPQNVVISEDGVVKLLDFGIAQADDDIVKTVTGSILGTFFYAPPEQNQGKKVDRRSDIYALGLILYELLTGKRALAGTDLMQVTLTQMKGQIPRPTTIKPDIPPALEKLIMKCIERDPANRPGDCKELLTELQAIKADARALSGAGSMGSAELTELFEKAKTAHLKKELDSALKLALELLEKKKDSAELHNLLGKIYMDKKTPFQAIDHFKQAQSLAPKERQFQIDYAIALFKMDMVDKAKAEFKKIAERDPENIYVKSYLNQIRTREEQALKQREQTLTKKPAAPKPPDGQK
ncbi:MAG: protein kinase [Candidatus Riflebacteria bacterium]|nr:protein kinase [Candidatus Riflebacteria bacterium]